MGKASISARSRWRAGVSLTEHPHETGLADPSFPAMPHARQPLSERPARRSAHSLTALRISDEYHAGWRASLPSSYKIAASIGLSIHLSVNCGYLDYCPLRFRVPCFGTGGDLYTLPSKLVAGGGVRCHVPTWRRHWTMVSFAVEVSTVDLLAIVFAITFSTRSARAPTSNVMSHTSLHNAADAPAGCRRAPAPH